MKYIYSIVVAHYQKTRIRMNKIIVLLLLTVGLISCKTSEKGRVRETNKLETAKRYYKALNTSDDSEMLTLLGDSIVIRENADNYEERFSRKGYTIWLEWDSVFEPKYKILEIEEENEVVKAKISKIDQRIFFLTEEPIVWYEIIRFDNNKIVKVEKIEYEVFNVAKFLKNRDRLVNWIDKNHSELSGFLYPQTKSVGMKYLKAIELYNNKK
ncbi:hypothetical protein [Aquimarina muelleri]|nr:hypothetical protein [Aquimarina muelleri]MCX2761895.1 hypothetical protein [Aquimarina muelleri]